MMRVTIPETNPEISPRDTDRTEFEKELGQFDGAAEEAKIELESILRVLCDSVVDCPNLNSALHRELWSIRSSKC